MLRGPRNGQPFAFTLLKFPEPGFEMSDTNGAGAGQQDLPQLNVLTQFTKDLSFENPNAPASLSQQQNAPNISIQVNVNAQKLTDTDYEVTLQLEGTA